MKLNPDVYREAAECIFNGAAHSNGPIGAALKRRGAVDQLELVAYVAAHSLWMAPREGHEFDGWVPSSEHRIFVFLLFAEILESGAA